MFIVVASFTVVGTAYGVIVGTLRSTRDAVAMMSDALKEMLPFIAPGFISLFTGPARWIASRRRGLG